MRDVRSQQELCVSALAGYIASYRPTHARSATYKMSVVLTTSASYG